MAPYTPARGVPGPRLAGLYIDPEAPWAALGCAICWYGDTNGGGTNAFCTDGVEDTEERYCVNEPWAGGGPYDGAAA